MAEREGDHLVAVLACEGLAAFELGVTVEVFALPRPELDVERWYEFALCAEKPGPLRAIGGFEVCVPHGLEVLDRAATVIVAGVPDVRGDVSQDITTALRDAHRRGARMVSICSGAFVLAAAGLLDGRRAATHWRYAQLLARRFPRVAVDAGVLFVDDGDVLTSAGTAAGIDLCLHLVRMDHGAAVANEVARRMVVPPQRQGGQAQYIVAPVPEVDDDPVAETMDWALSRLAEPLTVRDLARRAHLSDRQYSRRFAAATGTTPGRWLAEARIRASLPLLERSTTTVEDVGRRVGMPAPAGFRRQFSRVMGVPPSAYRQTFRGTETPTDQRRAPSLVKSPSEGALR